MDELIRSNVTRKECETQIRRILITEILQNGQNKHFKKATDFVKYFESLYPQQTLESLTKQIQRAVKSLNMPKDENGFFIIDRTQEQVEQDKELHHLLDSSHASIIDLDECEKLFIALDPNYRAYLSYQISHSNTLREKYVTIIETHNGLIFYTKDKKKLEQLLQRLMLSTS